MRKHSPYLMILIGALIFILGPANLALSMQRGYLQTFKEDKFRDLTKVRFLNVNSPRTEYVSWPEGQKEAVLSLRYRMPVGWWVCLFKEKDDDSQTKCWPGTGREESVTKDAIPEFLHKEARGHYWHR